MNILKKIGLVLLGIIILLLIIAIFIKKEYKVEKSVVINKPKQEVFDYIKNFRNQMEYNKWTMPDPNMKTEFRGQDGAVGSVFYWNGNDDVGEGEQEIKTIVEGKRLDIELRFKRPFESTANAFMFTDEVSPTQTRVTWGMEGRSSYPMNLMNIFMDSMLGNTIHESLEIMKSKLEKK